MRNLGKFADPRSLAPCGAFLWAGTRQPMTCVNTSPGLAP